MAAHSITSPLYLLFSGFLLCIVGGRFDEVYSFQLFFENAPQRSRNALLEISPSFTPSQNGQRRTSRSMLSMSLKPAAISLMDSGKALARSGELLIDLTSNLSLYGGSLSASGASVRNCGDALAQAAASCRFKTASELVIDELREGASCLFEGVEKLKSAAEESAIDGEEGIHIVERILPMIEPMDSAATNLENVGASILRRESVDKIGFHLIQCSHALLELSKSLEHLEQLDESSDNLAAQRMLYASEKMGEAGKELRGEKKQVKGKSWIKG